MGNSGEYLKLISDYVIKQHKIENDTPHTVEYMDGIDLLTLERIDIAAKIKFIDAYETGKDMKRAEELYRKHIDAFTDGHFTEYGNRNKNTYEKYKKTFIKIIESIKKEGFNPEISLIPVGADNVAIGGAHRIACAVYFKKKVKVVKFNHIKTVFDYNYFRKHLLDEQNLLLMVQEYAKYKGECLIAYIWPKGFCKKHIFFKELEKEKIDIVYKKTFTLNYESHRRLIHEIYKNEEWIGNEKNDFIGIAGKALLSYKNHGKMICVVLYGVSPKKAEDLKQIVRKKIGYKKRSMHMTDTNEETVDNINFLLNLKENKNKKLSALIIFIKKKARYRYLSLLIFVKKKIGKPI